ncbi:MAG: RND family efflux transporter MFP subunit, partial [Myxococcota bacterium]
ARVGILRVQRKGAKGMLQQAKTAVTLTEKQLARDTKLAKDGHLAAASADRTRLELTGQRDRLRAAKTTSGSLPHQITEARAQIAAAEQELASQERLLKRTTMVAEFDLQVREGGLEDSAWVSVGQPIAVLEDVSAVELAYPVPLDDLMWMSRTDGALPESRHAWAGLLTGRTVEVHGGPGSAYKWTGIVHRVGAGLTQKTRMIEVFVRVTATIARPDDSPALPLLPGMFCSLSIGGRTLTDVVVLPRKTVQPDGDIYLVGPDNTLEKRSVAIAISEGDIVVVEKGLKPGDRVITTSLPGAVSGMKLQVRGDKRKKGKSGKDVADR